jgi:tripartite-type tricarboxylate transporter receptor subunit TctC
MIKYSIKTSSYIFLASMLLVASVFAQNYPTRPLRMIIGFPPGGPTDLIARLVGQHLFETFAQPVVIDNRPGAAGAVAGLLMLKSAPDGHTLFVASNGEIAISPSLYKKMAYDTERDIAPVSRIGGAQLVLMVHPSVPAHSVNDLLALARAKPGAINFASSGIGSTAHLATELLKFTAGVDMMHVPYKGAGPALTETMGGQVQMLITGFSAAQTHIRSGKLRALGMTGATRVKAMPDVPTIGESVPGYQMMSWYGLFTTVGTPPAIIGRLHGEVAAMLKRPDYNEKFVGLGMEPEGSTPQTFATSIKEEKAKWAKVIKMARVPLQ